MTITRTRLSYTWLDEQAFTEGAISDHANSSFVVINELAWVPWLLYQPPGSITFLMDHFNKHLPLALSAWFVSPTLMPECRLRNHVCFGHSVHSQYNERRVQPRSPRMFQNLERWKIKFLFLFFLTHKLIFLVSIKELVLPCPDPER